MKTGKAKPKSGRTEAQQAASRANGAKSRGPVTEQGKQRSSMNAFKHGVYAKEATLLYFEDRKSFEEMRENYFRRFAPADPFELGLVEEIIQIDWTIQRLQTQITQALHTEMHRQAPTLEVTGAFIDPFDRLNHADDALGRRLDRLYRRIGQLRRERNTTLNSLIKSRRGLPPLAEPTEVHSFQPVDPDPFAFHRDETNPDNPALPPRRSQPAAPALRQKSPPSAPVPLPDAA